MKKWLRFFTSSLLVILVFLAFGYWFGHKPNLMYRFLKIYHHEVILIVYPKDLLPTNLVQHFQNQITSPLRVIYPKNDDEFRSSLKTADIVLTSLQFIKNNEFNVISKFHPTTEKVRQSEVNPDFLTTEVLSYNSIPIFWKVSEYHFSIYGFFFSEKSTEHAQTIHHLMSKILKKETLLEWTRAVPYSSTMSKMDETGLDPEKKSGFIRSYDLKKIKGLKL